MPKPEYSRAFLHDRHRLSHQQIDAYLNENRAKEFVAEKFSQLKAVKKFLEVTDLLRDNHIDFTCFKGPLLSYRIYGDATVRISKDVDLLIDPNQLDQIIKLLLANGYSHADKEVEWPSEIEQQKMFKEALHHLEFYNKGNNQSVEVHWVLMHQLPLSSKKMSQLIDENKETFLFAGRDFSVFSPEFEFIYLLIHGSKHRWQRLKWLVDIKDYPINLLDQQIFMRLYKKMKMSRICFLTNHLLKSFFDVDMNFLKIAECSLPNYFLNHPIRIINSERYQVKTNNEHWDYKRYLWYLYPGFRYKYIILSGLLFHVGDLSNIKSRYKIVYLLYRPYSFLKRRLFK